MRQKVDCSLYKGKPTKNNLREAIVSAYRSLSYRLRSIHEMRGLLEKKGFPCGVIEQTIERLIELDYLNDEKFAKEWAASAIRNRSWGRKRIRIGLAQKGIDREIIEKTVGTFSCVDEKAVASKELKRWLDKESSAKKTGLGKRESAYRYLLGKGFTHTTVSDVLAELLNFTEETCWESSPSKEF